MTRRLAAVCVVIGLLLATGALEVRAGKDEGATRIRVDRISEQPAPGCGGRLVLRYRACAEVRSCRKAREDGGLRSRLLAAIDRYATRRAGESCARKGCGAATGAGDRVAIECEDRRTLCATETSWWRCEEEAAGTGRAPKPVEIKPLVARPFDGSGDDDRILGFSAGEERDFVIGCVDPPAAQAIRAGRGDASEEAARDTDPDAGLRRARIALPPALAPRSSGGVAALVFGGEAGQKLAAPAPTSCEGIAWQRFYSEGTVHPAMPPVNYPKQPCGGDRCEEVRLAWARTHHNVWVARSILHYIASRPASERKLLWHRTGLRKNGKPLFFFDKGEDEEDPADDVLITDYYTLEYWFGPYSDKVFNAVKRAVDKLWEVVTSGRTGLSDVKLTCPKPEGGVCRSKRKPVAHHIVRGKVHLCDKFFDRSEWRQTFTITHELLHHLWTKWGKAWVAIQDTHYHGHGLGCGLSPETKPMYGEKNVRHLAWYKNKKGNSCGHQARGVRNNDTYAYYITVVGNAVYRGWMHSWPDPLPEPEPPPQAPNCVGGENCLCESSDSWPASVPFEPDGDYRADMWCDDNDGEMTCRRKIFSGKATGICVKCETERGPGCECDAMRPCDVGSCYGADTWGGGVGHCWNDPPPSWACLADCKRLFNDEGAWCYADHPSGKARCMDSFCSEPEAFNCWNYSDVGKVCRESECVTECITDADCAEKGYPPIFHCTDDLVCEVP